MAPLGEGSGGPAEQWVERAEDLRAVRELLGAFPVVALLGARQVGKSTLARQIAAAWPEGNTFFDLEDPADEARLAQPSQTLRRLRGLVVLDEAQRRPDLLPLLRVLADRPGSPARFLLLGSVSSALRRDVAESLAGRIAYYELAPFSVREVGTGQLERLWLRGGMPRAFLAPDDAASYRWRQQFLRTFFEADVPALGVRVSAAALRRFWRLLAHAHGRQLNYADLGRTFGVSEVTARRYVELLAQTFVVRILNPWHANLAKRQVKRPKLYLADSGLLHAMLGLERVESLWSHPAAGLSWEGFAMAQVVRVLGLDWNEHCWFWGTHGGAELDLLVRRGERVLGFEFKWTDAPRMRRSMRVALADLQLERLVVVHTGRHAFDLDERVLALPLRWLDELPATVGWPAEEPAAGP